MTRFECMQRLAAHLKDELVILSLGASVDEWYTAAPKMREASLFQQQLGCVTPEAFGLAVGLPHRRVVSLDTDGGLLFNLGILATVGNEQPPNLLIVVWDNHCYQSIGGPPTHTASGRVDLAAIARGARPAARGLTPLKLITKIATLVPPPRAHRLHQRSRHCGENSQSHRRIHPAPAHRARALATAMGDCCGTGGARSSTGFGRSSRTVDRVRSAHRLVSRGGCSRLIPGERPPGATSQASGSAWGAIRPAFLHIATRAGPSGD